MIFFGPLIAITDWLTTSETWRRVHRLRGSQMGMDALALGKTHRGRGEEGANNQGNFLYWLRGGKDGGPWCAAWIYTIILIAYKARGRPAPFKRTHSARKLFRRIVEVGMLVNLKDLHSGDFVLWARGGRDSGKGHIGIVDDVVRDRDTGNVVGWTYWAGNEGSFPAVVAPHTGTHRKRRIGFARLP